MNKFEIDSDCADRLIREQRSVWALLDKNCQALERVETRIVFVEGVPVTLQFNPERIRSAAAVVDRQSIQNRKCFLCEENQTRRSKSGLLLPGSMSCLPIRILFSLNI